MRLTWEQKSKVLSECKRREGANIYWDTKSIDAGVIAVLKKRYRKKQMERALDLLDGENTSSLYKVDLLTAIMWVCEIWDGMEPSILHNCWCKTGIIKADQGAVGEEMRIDEDPSHEGEDDCVGEIGDQRLLQSILDNVHTNA